mmetsp:Transcript_18260/g.27371  ORF Transcript_18260/g.27371 Transcript_18260/m.27371 type:complete len:215 (-) Transcript_18260:301-945(-)
MLRSWLLITQTPNPISTILLGTFSSHFCKQSIFVSVLQIEMIRISPRHIPEIIANSEMLFPGVMHPKTTPSSIASINIAGTYFIADSFLHLSLLSFFSSSFSRFGGGLSSDSALNLSRVVSLSSVVASIIPTLFVSSIVYLSFGENKGVFSSGLSIFNLLIVSLDSLLLVSNLISFKLSVSSPSSSQSSEQIISKAPRKISILPQAKEAQCVNP